MSEIKKIKGTVDAWDSKELGYSLEHAKAADEGLAKQIDESLGLQMISIRLNKELIDAFKLLGRFHGIGYQPLMRDALQRFATAEMKAVVSGMVESQKQQRIADGSAQESVEKTDCDDLTPESKKAA